jgi:hypothetical protein
MSSGDNGRENGSAMQQRRPTHPAGKAALLMVAIAIVVIVLAVISTAGGS